MKLDTAPVRVGRDPGSDIVLRENAVSRDDATFMLDDKGAWVAGCVSVTTPVLVDGSATRLGAAVHDDTQILVGKEHLILFSFNEAIAAEHVGTSAGYASCTNGPLVSRFSVAMVGSHVSTLPRDELFWRPQLRHRRGSSCRHDDPRHEPKRFVAHR